MDFKKIFLLTSAGSLILFGALLPLFALLFRNEVIEQGGWFAEPSTYVVIPWGQALGWALFFAVCGGAFLHGAIRDRFHYKNAIARCLESGEFGRAWELAIRFDEFASVESHLRDKVELGGAAIKNSIFTALQHLRLLRSSASDRLNRALTDDLRVYTTSHAEKGLAILGGIVERLVLLDRQAVDPQKLADRLEKIRKNIDQLGEATEAARVRLADLSLGAERDTMAEEATVLIRQVSIVAEELHRFDNKMSQWEASAPDHRNAVDDSAAHEGVDGKPAKPLQQQ